jgi:signal transduction histidine kinase
VTIDLDVDGPSLVLRVIDDGAGMPAPADHPSDWPHYGLAAMRERAAAAGGTVTWAATEPHGTEVRLEVPLRALRPGSAAAGGG